MRATRHAAIREATMGGQLRTRATVTVSVAAATTIALTLCAPLARADDSGQKNGRYTAGAPGVGDVYYPLGLHQQ